MLLLVSVQEGIVETHSLISEPVIQTESVFPGTAANHPNRP